MCSPSSTNLPSSHGGGVLPGNQMGLSGAAARTVNVDRDAALPALRKEVRAPANPLLGSAATVAAEEEETNAIGPQYAR